VLVGDNHAVALNTTPLPFPSAVTMVTTLGATFLATAGTASSPAPVGAEPDGTTPAVGTAALVESGASEGGEVEPVHAEDMSPSASTRTTPRAGILTP
jgi:hypothetical protein